VRAQTPSRALPLPKSKPHQQQQQQHVPSIMVAAGRAVRAEQTQQQQQRLEHSKRMAQNQATTLNLLLAWHQSWRTLD
jgi:hypothetical protein